MNLGSVRGLRWAAAGWVVCLAALAPSVWAQQGGKPDAGGVAPPTPVVIGRVEVVTDAPKAEFTGLIQSATKVLLSAEATGRLVRLAKREGDMVRKDEVVAELENPTMDDDYAVRLARIKETEAQLHLSEQQQERNKQLFERKLTTAQQYEDGSLTLEVARAKLHADRVQVERLKDQLERMVIRSPIAGQVVTASVEVGQWITPNQTLFEIYNYDAYEVLVGVPSRLIAALPDTGAAEVHVPEIGATLTGEILAVVRHVNSATGNFNLRVRVSNRQGLPLSGMLAKVRLPLDEARRMITVPRDAVVRRGERTHVVVVTPENTALIVPVQVQGNFGSAVIVTGKGLAAGMPVVVRGNERLFPGTPVRVAGDQSTQASG